VKIAHFLAHYPCPGGTTSAIRGLVKELVERGVDVEIWTVATQADSAPVAGVPVRRFRRNRLFSSLISIRFLWFLIHTRSRYDLVVAHGAFSPVCFCVGLVLRLVGTRFLLCPHVPYHRQMLRKGRVRKTLYAPFERVLLNMATAVQVLADSHVDLLRRFGVRSEVVVVPIGISIPQALTVRTSGAAGLESGNRFLFLGRLDTFTKGLDLLIVAVAKLRESLPAGTTFSLVGPDGGDRHELENLAKAAGVSDIICFCGPDYVRPPVEIIADHDILILPSRFDGFPTVVMEAMAAGRPMIVSNEAGNADHVLRANCGWVIKADAEGIAEGIRESLEHRGRWTDLGSRGNRYVLQHLSWALCAEQAIECYRRIARRSGDQAGLS
jgi:glycosyltransferase involved in cell wall biosynthesis